MSRLRVRNTMTAIMLVTLLSTQITGCSKSAVKKDDVKQQFSAKLDVQKNVTLSIAGNLSNFEALDQVINNFNQYYPNVLIGYENSGELRQYLENNPDIDIFMTSDSNIRDKSDEAYYIADYCYDLTQTDIDFSDMQESMISCSTVDGQLLRIPLMESMSGMVVNKTLLERERLDIPLDYEELLDTCEVLKQKGYMPIQGAKTKVYSDMILNVTMNIIGNDRTFDKKFEEGNTDEAVELFRDSITRINTIIEKEYTDYSLNEQYPDDNYDGAILRFFEGDVPFWICNAEKVSGMKKRESKSESYTKDPFEYTFVYVPLGDNGAYEYIEPWQGFSVNKNSDELDYAIEFIRFLVDEEQLNTLAEIKGMPSVAKASDNMLYSELHNTMNIEGSYIYKAGDRKDIQANVCNVTNTLGSGKYADVEEAMEELKKRCR